MGADVVEVEVGDGGGGGIGQAGDHGVVESTAVFGQHDELAAAVGRVGSALDEARRFQPTQGGRETTGGLHDEPGDVAGPSRVLRRVYEVGQHSNLGGRGGGLGTDIGCHRIGQPTETAQEEGEGQGIHLDKIIFPQSFVASGWVGRGAVPHPVNIVSS